MSRKESLETAQVYHVFNRSIAGYIIFTNTHEYNHMIKTLRHYRDDHSPGRLSHSSRKTESAPAENRRKPPVKPIDLIAFCLMPTHFHLIVRQVSDGGISKFVANIENSYARYFNTKHQRKGPLWEGKFKNVLVTTDEQLLHLTRYIHLNPTTADLTALPEKWAFSSYKEYITQPSGFPDLLCQKDILAEISPTHYRSFVTEHISYQKELAMVKHLLFE